MKLFFRALLIVALMVCAGCTKDGGDDSNDGVALACAELHQKILNGEQCTQSESPVVLLVIVARDESFSGICTGTLITPTQVLTAAHCVSFEKPTTITVRAGTEAIEARQATAHPRFVPNTQLASNYDVAIVTLARPSALPTVPVVGSRTVADNERLTVFGYGLDEKNQSVEVYGVEALKATYVREYSAEENLIITRYDDTETGACEGDSGGPLTAKVSGRTGIIGIVQGGTNPESPGAAGCGEGFYDIFTAIHASDVLNFILTYAPDAQVI